MSGRLAEGYAQHEGEGLSFAARPQDLEPLRALGLDRLDRVRLLLAAGRQAGRGRIGEARPRPGRPGRPLILKQILHGGLPGRFNSRAYAGPGRVLAELDLTARARQRGVPAPEIPWVAWTRGWPCELFLATVKIEGARNLAQVAAGEPAGPVRASLLAAAARAVRQMHDAGLRHKDLNLRNVVVAAGPEGHILDLGGSRLLARLDDPGRVSNLARLLRSLRKAGLEGRVSRREQAAFLLAYAGGSWPRYRELKGSIARRARWHPLHRLAWGPAGRS